MKKVLIITYYWPPAGGGGVQRWLKFAKYLPEFGWQPVIYTPENPDYPLLDESMLADVDAHTEIVRLPIFEPYRWYRNLSGKKKATLSAGFIREKKSESLSSRFISWLRGNVIIPDARRYWIRPSVRFLRKYLSDHPVDAVITTGPPQSMHLIGLQLKKRMHIRWIADFRDPWVNMDNADKLHMGARAMNKHRNWERQVLQNADEVITTSRHVAKQYEEIRRKKVHAITNGFDPVDFPSSFEHSEDFVIGHFGTMGDDRNPENVWKIISELVRDSTSTHRQVKLLIAGPTDSAILESIENAGLSGKLTYTPYLSHEAAIREMMRCNMLLLPLNRNMSEEGRIPGKIFEYMATGNFVLGIGSPTGDSAQILSESNAGKMLSYEDYDGLKRIISERMAKPAENRSGNIGNEAYTRKSLTSKLVDVLNSKI